jgi:hypothetical protein
VSHDELLQITDHYRFHNSLPLVSIGGQINLSHALKIKSRPVSILPPQLRPISLSGFIPYNKQLHFPALSYVLHVPLIPPPWFNQTNFILEAVSIMKLNMKIFLQRPTTSSVSYVRTFCQLPRPDSPRTQPLSMDPLSKRGVLTSSGRQQSPNLHS